MSFKIKGIFFDLTRVIQLDPYPVWFFISDLKYMVKPGVSRQIFLDNEEEQKKDSVNISPELKKEILHYLRFKKRTNWQLVRVIEQLAKNYKIGIISNHGPKLEQRIKEKMGINHQFDAVISSGDWGVEKPNSKIYQIALEKINLKPQDLIYIDDNSNYVAVAESLGMKGIVYKNLNQLLKELSFLK
ncbi:MAG: hypothetical protein A3J62_01730 [Candidatus Buchananbacteria bacterium RIFCSPHIGHO2_02_FULL_38_8]|uniref:Uncharacterized protein n=2 Tax=Candidatus Buchananiibacteriota TaxID=1817903 RepID=A0A1G1XYA0_9BACT|nr:MAG: hypothetical protein A2731_00410 [Candidatus Buchananbacteria bacterium RIFCSPHIGHO2_01_FULL_39_8]OGY47312.1 MAG: hypothetical protein A3J62_01730 [Candidatus Buchananbacteria bacterium RIFCSPHIGHO2_02_FULL_38_8]